MDENTTKITEPETDAKVTVAFKCTQEMADFIKQESGEESYSWLLRSWIREKMEAKKQLVEA